MCIALTCFIFTCVLCELFFINYAFLQTKEETPSRAGWTIKVSKTFSYRRCFIFIFYFIYFFCSSDSWSHPWISAYLIRAQLTSFWYLFKMFINVCSISTERHRAEIRRAISDDRLSMIAEWWVCFISHIVLEFQYFPHHAVSY